MRTYLIIAAIIALGLSHTFVGFKAYYHGKDVVMADWQKSINGNKDRKINLKGKLDEIKNAPVDNAVTDRRLLHSTY